MVEARLPRKVRLALFIAACLLLLLFDHWVDAPWWFGLVAGAGWGYGLRCSIIWLERRIFPATGS